MHFGQNEDDDFSKNQWLLERDSSRMTRLHRAAFYGDQETVERILEIICNNFSLIESFVMGFTPFYSGCQWSQGDLLQTVVPNKRNP
jgi:ankyrin repeat protein